MNRYVCHVMDLYSRYSHVRSFPTKEAAPIAEWLLELYINGRMESVRPTL